VLFEVDAIFLALVAFERDNMALCECWVIW
jgi:hypothetical protein